MYENNIKDIIKAQNGDKEELAKIVEKNKGLIWNIVKRFSGRGYETEDLYQIGCIGFIKSIKRFDTSFDVKLSTYSVPYILGEIKRIIRDDGAIKVSRGLKELNVKVLDIQKQYSYQYGKEISIQEISEKLKVSKEEIAMALEANRAIDSLDDVCYSDGKSDKSVKIYEKISSGKDEATEIANKLTIKKLINSLDQKEKEIIMLRFYKDKTQTEVSKILGITQVQVSRIERKILSDMKKKIVS